jgi:ABC-type transport system substrate-binding protein/protocatechuate 3,4-dioxygenase beta subunit
MQQDMPNFNNWDLNSNSVWKDYVIGKWCWEGLSGLDPGGNLYPGMAEEWTFDDSDDTNLTVNVKLREGATFHDGEDFDADDVLFTFSAMRDGTTYASNIIDAFDADGDGTCSADEIDGTIDANGDGSFEGITKIDAHNVKMIMGKPYGQFFLMTLGVPIIPEHIWKDHLTAEGIVDILWNTDPAATIGTGPMMYHSGEADVFRRIVVFEDYWGVNDKSPSGHWLYPQTVTEIYFTLYASLDTAILALKSGQVDHIPWTVTPGYVPDLLQNPNTDIESISDNGYFYLAFNMKREPMNYLSFRKAVSHTIDKETIVERYMGGYGQAGDSSEPPFWNDWYNSSVKIYPFDVDLAKAELTSGGFTGVGSSLVMPNGKPCPPLVLLTPPADYDPIRIKAGELIAKNLRSLGMDIVAKPVDFDTLVAKMNAFDYDMLIIGWSLSSDPVGNVFDILGPMASQNYFGWWPVDHAYENPWYNELYGVSTLADAESQAMAIECHDLGQVAKESFDRDVQIKYTKWAQGIVADALPCNVLYYRVNNYAIATKWEGWIPYFGELLNVYSLGALSSEVTPPTIEEVNVLLNVPEKLALGMPIAANAVVFDGEGKPIEGADVTMSGDNLVFTPATGTTDADGTFMFDVEGTKHTYVTITVDVDDGGTTAALSRIVSVVAPTPDIAFLYVQPAALFLAPGESTDVDMYLLMANGDPLEGVTIELDEGLMGYGSVDTTTVTTDASGYGKMVYTAPASFPMNKHIQVRLSLSAAITEDYTVSNVNTVTQFLVLYNEAPSMWEFIQIEDVTKIACNATDNVTDVTVMVSDENGDPVDGATITAMYSNMDAIEAADDTMVTNATGHAVFNVDWDETADTNATQVTFKNEAITNGVGTSVSLLFKGATMMDLYGGYIKLKTAGTPMLDPDTAGDLTWEVHVMDLDDMPADTDISFIVGEPSDGSTAAMVDAPDHVWTSLWDYAGINIFNDADKSTMATSGYFLTNRMTDDDLAAIPNNLYTTWDFAYNDWYGGVVDELENMTAVQVTGGMWEVSVERDTVVLSDNVPSLLVVPNGKAGFYCTPDYANFWWQMEGETAWKQEFVMQRTNTITSVMAEFDTGVLRPYAPDNEAMVDMWAYDQDGNPVADIDIDAWVQVYGGSPFFDFTAGPVTDAMGMTTATIMGEFEDGGGNPLSNPVKQPMYIQAAPDYGWSVFTSVEIFNVPIQLYLSIEATPIIQAEGETAAEAEILITVVDEGGAPQEGFDVSFTHEGGSLSAMSGTTDAEGKVLVTYTMPEIAEGDDFTFGAVASSVTSIGYGAASAGHALVAFTPTPLFPPTLTITAPVDGSSSDATVVAVTGTMTDVQGIQEVTVKLDDGNLMLATLDGETWSITYEEVTVGEHTIVVVVYNIVGLSDTASVTFTTTEPPVENDPPVTANITPASGTKITEGDDGTEMTVTIDVTDDHGVASVKVRLDEGEWKDMTITTGDTYSYTFTDLAVGTYDVDIEVTDTHGEKVTGELAFEVEEKIVDPPDDDDDDDTDYTWLYIVIVIIIILIIVAAVFMSRGGGAAPAPEPEPEPEPESDDEDEVEEEDEEEEED